LIFVLLAAPPHSRPAQEISNKGKCFGVAIAMFKSVDVNVRPQEHPDEAPDERLAPGTAAYGKHVAESLVIVFLY